MLLPTQLHCGVVVRFVICICLVGSTAAKCVPEKCGSMDVSYPFWIHNSDCGYPGFQILCRKDEVTGIHAPYFTAFLGNYSDDKFSHGYDFKIMEIKYEGHLFIDSSSIKAVSCDSTVGARNYFQVPLGGRFTLCKTNRFVVIGDQAFGSFSFGKLGEARCVSINLQSDKPYCRYGCCEISLPDNLPSINFTGGGLFQIPKDNNKTCGFYTIMDPSTFTIGDNETKLFWGEGMKASYGLSLNWDIGYENCSTAEGTTNYSCSSNAECLVSPSGKEGHVCKCLPGYVGNGYINGTDCTDINECSYREWNMCVGADQRGICHNLEGSYSCSCAKGYAGDGFRNGTGCTDIDECSPNSSMCVETDKGGICDNLPGSYICSCASGYVGDGFRNGTGCTDENECIYRNQTMCVGAEEGGICYNLVGSYNCSCAKGYVGDGFRNETGCMSTSSNSLVFPAIIGSVSSFVVVSLAASLLVWWLKKRHLKLVEAKYYQQLQQHIASTVGRESLRIFSAKELARASNNYSKEMMLGSGGFGIVFKGILLDGSLVAIKKSKKAINVEDDHEFLNEVTILSQINHRNIVKLLGCCIQTKFPLLVSEFVPNGTLFEHLHSKEGSLSWASRLQIAIETGEALAYLHSGASQPIFHRDVKSSNILLNERFSPKVADFGISRLISTSNNTHLTTNIMGTGGYLDPEYFQTYQLTEKSDVYSFGVVLVELLTALKPISVERANHEWSLSSLFLSRLNSNRLREILDSKILEESLQEMEDMARIARECLQFERRKRPSMKEVVEELVWVRGGARKTKFHDSGKCEDTIFEKTSISREASQTSYEVRSYTFPVESTLEEPFTALRCRS